MRCFAVYFVSSVSVDGIAPYGAGPGVYGSVVGEAVPNIVTIGH